MRDLFIAAALTAVLVWPSADIARGQTPPQNRPPVFTDPAQGGVDYQLQGEYFGWTIDGGLSGPTGLQVIALGDGKFDAVQYRGGLPGNGWDRSGKSKLSGAIENDRLILNGDGESIFIGGGGQAVAVDSLSREIGRLTKMERRSPTLGLAPPPNALVLFDGSSTDQFVQPAPKISPDGNLMAGALTKMPVAAFRMHVEFKTPFMPSYRDQKRGNSGIYIQRRYEVQILDSFGLEGLFNQAGSLYRQTPPDLNMAFPPLTWQTYDIWFTPPSFAADGKTKTANAHITVLHNGIPVHWRREITAKTGGGQPEAPSPLPIQLQSHKGDPKNAEGDPVMYRNIWLVPGDGDQYWQDNRSASISCGGSMPYNPVRFAHRWRCG